MAYALLPVLAALFVIALVYLGGVGGISVVFIAVAIAGAWLFFHLLRTRRTRQP